MIHKPASPDRSGSPDGSGSVGHDGVEVRIRALLPSLTPAERRVGEAVLADPGGTAGATISELADKCSTSLTTVTRFCRALGLPGYQELRLALATDAGRVQSRNWAQGLSPDIAPDDTLEHVLASLVQADSRAIEETAAQLDLRALDTAVSAMATARRTDIYAVSGSGSVGLDLQLRLHHIGCMSHVWSDVHDALASAALLGPDDVAIGLSHSGETREVIEPLERAGRRGATTIAITNFPRSPLAAAAEVVLTTATREMAFRSGGLSARHAQMVVLDCLYIGVAQRTYVSSEPAIGATAEAIEEHRARQTRADS